MSPHRSFHFPLFLLAALGGLTAASACPVTAQEEAAEEAAEGLPRAALGAGLGLLGGVGITVANVVARAHWSNEYLHDPGDLIHWQSTPMILAPAAGAAFGLHGWETLAGAFLGSAAGFGIGVGAGAVLGALTMDTEEGPWAGGAMGGGWGLAIGGILGAYMGWREVEGLSVPISLGLRVPAGTVQPGSAR